MNIFSVAPVTMLVVEDNPADVFFFNEALVASQAQANTQTVPDGREAMRFLRRQGPYANAPRPDVIVLDLNLPFMNGREVLAELAADPDLRTIPVAILTTSSTEAHVCDAYPPGRCLYFVKTERFAHLQDIVRQIATHAHLDMSR